MCDYNTYKISYVKNDSFNVFQRQSTKMRQETISCTGLFLSGFVVLQPSQHNSRCVGFKYFHFICGSLPTSKWVYKHSHR